MNGSHLIGVISYPHSHRVTLAAVLGREMSIIGHERPWVALDQRGRQLGKW